MRFITFIVRLIASQVKLISQTRIRHIEVALVFFADEKFIDERFV